MSRDLPSAAEASAILAMKRSRPLRRPPPRAGRSLGPLIKALDARFGQGAEGLKARWREIAGDMLGARTEPTKLIKGRNGAGATLEIKVDGPAAALIQHQAPQLLQRVRLILGEGVVARLRIVQGPVRPAPARASASKPARLKAPLDAAAEAKLQAELAGAPDGPLKAALLKLGREVLRKQS